MAKAVGQDLQAPTSSGLPSIAEVNARTHSGTAWTRPSSVPASSATLLVTNYAYNSAGWLQDTIDPMGIDTRTNYDNLGRVTQTIQDYTNGTETAESNISTEYGYAQKKGVGTRR